MFTEVYKKAVSKDMFKVCKNLITDKLINLFLIDICKFVDLDDPYV